MDKNDVLYLKYRPKTLDEISGNENVVNVLKSYIEGDAPMPKSILFHGPTGCGKTTLGRIIASELGATEGDLKEIDSADFRGIDTIREIRKKSIYKPLNSPCRVWILDECFAKGTKIKMGDGRKKAIEDIEIGDQIRNLYGTGMVQHTFRNIVPLPRIIKINFERHKKSIICSKDHLFMTNYGWKKASDLANQESDKEQILILFPHYDIMLNKGLQRRDKNEEDKISFEGKSLPLLWRNFEKKTKHVLQQNLFQPCYGKACPAGNSNMPNLSARIQDKLVQPATNLFQSMWKQTSREKKNWFNYERKDTKKISTDNAESKKKQSGKIQSIMQSQFRAYEEKQPNEQSKKCGKVIVYKEAERNFTHLEGRTWWQRQINRTSNFISHSIGLADGGCNKNRTSFLRQEQISSMLQGGYRQSKSKTSNRSRWAGTQWEKNEVIRQEERGEINFIKVESVEIYQRGNNDKSFGGIIGNKERNQDFVTFYDLEINNHPSYIANGALVHNCHKMTGDAQSALLKALEDTPKHIYYILCTTEPQKLLPTIRGRCSQFQVEPLSDRNMKMLLRKVVKGEEEQISKNVYDQIVQDSMGHPRNALQILSQVLAVDDDNRLATAEKSAEIQSQTIELCRALIKGDVWKTVALILKGLKGTDAEQIRRAVLGYCQSVILNGQNDVAATIMTEFIEPFYNSGYPALVLACYSVLFGD